MNLIGDGPRTVVEALDRRAERGGADPAIWFEGLQHDTIEVSCTQLAEDARTAARRLAAAGVAPGDAVVIVLPTGPDFATSYYGTLYAGATPVPLYPPAGARQVESFLATVERVVTLTRPAKLITLEALASLVGERPGIAAGTEVTTPERLAAGPEGELPPPPTPEDLALIQFSSGSTGDPKGVALTHHAVVNNIRQYGHAVGFHDRGEVGASWLPLYHDMGLIGAFLGTVVWEMPLALMSPLDFLVRPAFWIQTMSRRRATLGVAPQFAYNLCLLKVRDEDLEGVDLSSVRVLMNGAEPVDLEAVERFERRFAEVGLRPGTILPCYGLAEHALCVSMHRPGAERQLRHLDRDSGAITAPGEEHAPQALPIASAGPAVEGTEIAVVRPEGQAGGAWEPLPEDELGEIAVRSESVCRGFVGPHGVEIAIDADGWLRTGDLGFLSDGELFVVDRLKDMVIVGGRNLFPHDIEREIRTIEGVRSRLAVFAHRNPELGTEGVVVAAETTLAERDELVRCAAELRRHVVETFDVGPYDVVLLPRGRIPLTSSGKVRRHRLRAEYENGLLDDDRLYALRGTPAGVAS
ncbi:MAG: AMP-binding protein [Actinomycetota bacterium]|nr:AMP-binding protein [Actinomycetota bacterium]